MKKFIAAIIMSITCVITLAGCNNLTPKEWTEKQTEMGTAYAEKLLAGEKPSSWSTLGTVIDYGYKNASNAWDLEFIGKITVPDGYDIKIEECYDDKYVRGKAFGSITVILGEEDADKVDATIKLLTKAYGNLNWVASETGLYELPIIEAVDVEYKPLFTPDIGNMYYIDEQHDEDVSVFDRGYYNYIKAFLNTLYKDK